MFEVIGAIASLIAISEKIYTGGKWVEQKAREWKVPVSIGKIDNHFKFPVEYYTLTTQHTTHRKFTLGRESFREENRLIHDRGRLLDFYPGISEQLLIDSRIGFMPYEVLSYDVDKVKVSTMNTKFTVRPSLRQLYDETYKGLVQYYRRAGIQYEPTHLARICGWNSESNQMCIQETEYTDAAATNMIADLDVRKSLCKTTLLENGAGIMASIREFDMALSTKPGYYPSLEESSLANPIGVAGIAITADNKLLLAQRSRRVSIYASRLGPSSSGYVTWHDARSMKENSLNELLLFALRREIDEELHIDLGSNIVEFKPLGIFREFYRAGMPQAFYCFKINITTEELVERILDAQDFREFIGILSIPVNRNVLAGIAATLCRVGRIGSMQVGLEAQGALTAFALHGESFL